MAPRSRELNTCLLGKGAGEGHGAVKYGRREAQHRLCPSCLATRASGSMSGDMAGSCPVRRDKVLTRRSASYMWGGHSLIRHPVKMIRQKDW